MSYLTDIAISGIVMWIEVGYEMKNMINEGWIREEGIVMGFV